jgi:hypothetical protein
MNFRYVPLDSATADRFRRTGMDGGNYPLEQAFPNARPSYVNIHTAQFGCFLCRVEQGYDALDPQRTVERARENQAFHFLCLFP